MYMHLETICPRGIYIYWKKNKFINRYTKGKHQRLPMGYFLPSPMLPYSLTYTIQYYNISKQGE